eukprot:COSAG06_NODE_59036_length_275_cov_0.875000_1_plen_21_part_10
MKMDLFLPINVKRIVCDESSV